MPTWAAYVIGAVIAALIAIFLAPVIPNPGDNVVAILAWIVCAICAILALVSLVRRPGL
jgi:hypothetical protein